MLLQKEAKTNFSCVIGSAEREAVEPGFCTVGLMADRDEDARAHLRRHRQAGEAAVPPGRLPRLALKYLLPIQMQGGGREADGGGHQQRGTIPLDLLCAGENADTLPIQMGRKATCL